MAAENQNFDWYIGEDRNLEIDITDKTGKVIDLTNAQNVKWVMAPDVTAVTATVTKTLNNGVLLTDPTNGVVTVTLNRDDNLTNVPPAMYYHQATVVDAQGLYHICTIGNVNVKPASTL